jgi:hypothetical protein
MIANDRPGFGLKLAAQRWQDNRGDKRVNGSQRHNDIEPFCGPIDEAYIEGRFEIHVHARAVFSADAFVPYELCAVFKYAHGNCVLRSKNRKLGNSDAKLTAGRYLDLAAGLYSDCHQKGTMLVDVMKLIEKPEPLEFGGIPSVVRLQFLDDCLGSWTDIPDSALTAFQKTITVSKDRESGIDRLVIGECPRMPNSQTVDEMIQGTPKIVETIANDRQMGSRRGLDALKPEDIITSIRIDVVADRIWVTTGPPLNPCLEVLQVLTRPL